MKKDFKRRWHGFWQLADPKIWIASTVSMIVAAALAYNLKGAFNLYWFVWTVVGIYLIEIGKNAINEVVDYDSGVDTFVTKEERTAFSGGKKTIVDGKLTVLEAKVIAILTMAAGALIGIYISVYREPKVFIIGVIGFTLSIIYSLPPFKLATGAWRSTVGLTFGPLIILGTYLVQTHTISPEIILVSLPIGLLITNVLWINQYPDYNADKKGAKMNWVVRLGRKKAVVIYILLFVLSYLSLFLIFIVFRNPFWLLPFVSFPLVLEAVQTARKYYDNVPKLVLANLRTVQVYQLFGLMLFLAAILDKVF